MPVNRKDGIVYICELRKNASLGDRPRYMLSFIAKDWYAERAVGFRRQYAAKGVNEQVDMLVRIGYQPKARIGCVAILGNGEQFRITNVTQARDDDTRLRVTELTLSRLEKYYDVPTQCKG